MIKYNLRIGATTYKINVYNAALSGHDTDGRFGWDLFKGKIVELNYDKGLMIIHSLLPNNITLDDKIEMLKMQFYKELFLFDTGYQRTAMLNGNLLAKGKFPTEKTKVLKKVVMHGAQGNEIPVITSKLNTLKIGNCNLKNVPVQVTYAKPFKEKDIHILGNEVLKRFNVFLDFQNNYVYLIPNHLFNDKYIEDKKKAFSHCFIKRNVGLKY